jgi:hypothetical protein
VQAIGSVLVQVSLGEQPAGGRGRPSPYEPKSTRSRVPVISRRWRIDGSPPGWLPIWLSIATPRIYSRRFGRVKQIVDFLTTASEAAAGGGSPSESEVPAEPVGCRCSARTSPSAQQFGRDAKSTRAFGPSLNDSRPIGIPLRCRSYVAETHVFVVCIPRERDLRYWCPLLWGEGEDLVSRRQRGDCRRLNLRANG